MIHYCLYFLSFTELFYSHETMTMTIETNFNFCGSREKAELVTGLFFNKLVSRSF